MLRFVPALLVTLVYIGFRVYGTRDRRVSRGLLIEALAFALCAHLVMWVYRKFWLQEDMSTFGPKCPNGYEMVTDPVNLKQETCVPVGQKTYSAETGFRGQSEK
uniref:Uncharacterized protein n=1 Tax=viral metagenome TaxID=1070528 RepID=A0A6C0CRF2_9ZZZZ